MRVIRLLHPNVDLIVAGHSSGGGFVFRIAVGPNADLFDRFLLLSPVMPYGAATYRPNVGGWATPFVGRIIALKVLNSLGIRSFNSLPIVGFAVDSHASVPLDESYSYRMQENFSAPHDALARLPAVKEPLVMLIGARGRTLLC